MEKRLTVPNGQKIRELRVSAGMTQEKLGLMSNVDRRTVQRAEKNQPVQIESLSSIASALSVPLPQIAGPVVDAEEEVEDLLAKSLVVLRPTQSGMTLINTIRGSFNGSIACEAEPTTENIDVLTAVVSALEAAMPDPWRNPMEDVDFPLSARLRTAVSLNEQLKQLNAYGIGVYTGTYAAKSQIPYYDMDEGHMSINRRSPYELVTICRIVIAATSRGDRISIKANDLYVPQKAAALETPEELQAHADMEDIPF